MHEPSAGEAPDGFAADEATAAAAPEVVEGHAAASLESSSNDQRDSVPARLSSFVLLGGGASLGAGAVHAAAIGSHAEHGTVVTVFSVLAALQLLAGAASLVNRSRAVALFSLVVNGGAFIGWLLAKTSGISFIDGLQEAEAVQWSDGLAALLAAVAGLGATSLVMSSVKFAGPSSSLRRPALQRSTVFVGSLALVGSSVAGMVNAANHSHSGSHAAGHGSSGTTHVHSSSDTGSANEAQAQHGDSHDDHGEAAAVASKPYDPSLPIDLSGVEGVTPQQQARAENLVAVTLAKLPQFADVDSLAAKGYFSIQDAFTGHEHFVNYPMINDGHELDPDFPESLVFEMVDGKKTLVSAMFFAEGGVGLDQVPDIGGKLTQWHIHNNLCYTLTDPPAVIGLTQGDGTCASGSRDLGTPVPMIHVWIRPHECGPFAALDGVGAGQILEGEERLCDTAHGHSHGSGGSSTSASSKASSATSTKRSSSE